MVGPSKKLAQQRLSFKDKIKDNYQWAKDNIDAISLDNTYQYGDDISAVGDRKRKLTNYRLYNNQIDQEDFEKVCNPFGLQAEEFKDIIQPFNKTYNKINVLLGEEWKRPYNYKTVLVNSEAVDEYERKKTELLREYVQTELNAEKQRMMLQMQEAAGQKVDPKELEQQLEERFSKVMDPSKIEEYMATSWRASTEIAADQILQYYSKKLNIKKEKNTAFKHALIAGEEFVWIGIIAGKPYLEVLNPLKTFYHKSPEVEYVQDGMYAGYRTRMTIADVLDKYAEDLTEDQKKELDARYSNSGTNGIRPDIINKEGNLHDLNKSFEWRYGQRGVSNTGSYGESYDEDIDVVHVEWKSQRKIGFKEYVDEDGETQMVLVDEAYKVPKGATTVKYTDKNGNNKTKYVFEDNFGRETSIEWGWIPEVWEGTKIDESIYINMRPKPFQFRSLEDPYKVKLGYYGLIYNAMNAPSVSAMDRMKPFYYLWLITMHKMQEILAADKAPLININMEMIPKKLTHEQYMYYNKLGINFFSPNQNNDAGTMPGQAAPTSETPRSTMQHVVGYINILNALDEQIGEAAGVTRQREGQTSQYESVSGTQSAIIQSSHITEVLFLAHNLLWQEILTGFLETVMMLYKDEEVKLPYVLDDMSRGVLNLKPDMFLNSEMGVFITDDARDHDALEHMKQLSLEMMQNGVPASKVMSLYRSTSAETWERQMAAFEKAKQDLEQQQSEMQSTAQERALKLEIDNREDVQKHELEMIDRKGEWDVKKAREAAIIQGMALNKNNDMDGDGIPDAFEVYKFDKEASFKANEQALKQKQIEEDSKNKAEDRKLKEKEIQSREKIEKTKAAQKKTKAN